MSGIGSIGRRRLMLIAAPVVVAAGIVVAITAFANTAISITSGNCSTSGGGTLFCFNPQAANGQTGAPVTWTNQSGAPHNLDVCDPTNCPGSPATAPDSTFNNVAIASTNGSTGSHTFTQAGTYYYYCTIHQYSGMHGSITVTASTPPPKVPDVLAPALGAGVGAGIVLLFWRSRRSKRSSAR